MKPAKHYLVFGFGMRWDGSDGYTLLDNRDDVLNRGYDVLDDILTLKNGGAEIPANAIAGYMIF